MPLDFLRRRSSAKNEADTRPTLLPEDVEAQEYTIKLTYRAKSSQGVRMTAGPNAMAELPGMLGIAISEVDVVEPLAMEFQGASPAIVHPAEALQ